MMFQRYSKDQIKRYIKPMILLLSIIFIPSICLYVIYFIIKCNGIDFIKSGAESVDRTGNENEIYAWIYYITAGATVALGIIAYVQLSSVNKELEANFFLDLEKLWMLERHAQARFIISELRRGKEDKKISACEFIAKLTQLKDSYLIEDRKKYQMIKDFLNLLEVMGYYYAKKYVSADQFKMLCGDVLKYYESIFNKYVIAQLDEDSTEDSLEYFRALVEEIKKIEKHSK
ncbi:MAG: hypothetical protein ACTHJ4_05385 [Candidatus Nucleicultricaceae bacterium]